MEKLISPINGSELKLTNTPGIMHSENDNLYYKVNVDGMIIPLKSPINGSELKLTNTPGIMYSENDNLYYKVNVDGMIIPLKSPINGSELKLTNTPGIMYSENDNLYYKVNVDGMIIPLKSPIHGGNLIPNEDGTLYDEHTGRIYEIKDTTIGVIKNHPVNKKLDEMDKATFEELRRKQQIDDGKIRVEQISKIKFQNEKKHGIIK